MVAKTESARAPVILVANGQDWLARSLETILEPQGYEVRRAPGGAALMEHARSDPPDLIIIDYDIADMEVAAGCRALRTEIGLARAVAIVVISSRPVTPADRTELLKAGAWLVLSLPMDSEQMVASVGNFVAAKLELDAARAQAAVDPTTGLYNASGISKRAAELAACAVRSQRALSCMVLTTTRAQAAPPGTAPERREAATPEDTFGTLLRTGVRASDIVGRLGLTEFVVLAPDTGPDGARQLARRISDLAGTIEDRLPDTVFQVRIGAFAAGNLAEEALEPTELLERAAAALRHTRPPNGNRNIQFFNDVQGNGVN